MPLPVPGRRHRSFCLSLVLLLLPLAMPAAWPAGEPDPAFVVGSGFNNAVEVIALQPDGRILCGGWFDTYQKVLTPYLARLAPDGSLDTAFAAQPRPDGRVRFILPREDGRLLIGGEFSKIGTVTRSRLAWLLPDGSLDLALSADVAYGLEGMLALPEGSVLLTGTFSQVAGQPRSWIARLRADGSLDPDYNPGASLFFAASNPLLLPGNQLLLDASWMGTGFGIRRDLLCRLNANGTLDPAFDTDSPVGFVETMAHLPDGSVAIANNVGHLGHLFANGPVDPDWPARVPPGYRRKLLPPLRDGRVPCAVDAETVGGVPHALHRLRADGSPDPTFTAHFNRQVECVAELPDGRLLVGGHFTHVNNLPYNCLALLRGDPTDTPPRVGWNGTAFAGEERTGRVRLPLRRTGRLDQPVSVQLQLRPATATPGHDYEPVTREITLAPGEALAVVDVPLLNDSAAEPDETFEALLTGDAVLPDAALAVVTIFSDEGALEFLPAIRTSTEAEPAATVELLRTGGVPYRAEAEAAYTGGTASPADGDWRPLLFRFAQGVRAANTGVAIRDDTLVEPDETAAWHLTAFPPEYVPGTTTNLTLVVHDNDLPGAPGEALPGPAQLLAPPDGGLLLAGIFRTVHGESRSNLARLRPDGSFDADFVPALSPTGLLLDALPDGRFYLSYTTTNAFNSSQYTNSLVRLHPDGTADPTFSPTNRWPVNGPQGGAVLADGSVVMENVRTDFSGLVQDLMKYGPDGQRIGRFASNAFAFSMLGSGTRWMRIARHGDGLLVGGNVIIPGLPPNPTWLPRRSDLFRLTAAGAFDPAFQCTLAGIPTSTPLLQDFVVAADNSLYVRGRFDRVDYTARPGLARLHRDGRLDTAFAPGAGLVQMIGILPPPYTPPLATTADQRLLLVLPNGTQLVRLRPNGPVDPAFGPVLAGGGAIHFLAPLADGRIALSGRFTTINGQPRWRLAWLNPSGQLLPDHPLTLTTQHTPAGDDLEIWANTRLAGRLQLEEAGPDWLWTTHPAISTGLGPVLLFEAPLSPGPRFFRARLLE